MHRQELKRFSVTLLVTAMAIETASADPLDDLRSELKRLFTSTRAAASFAALINFESEPGISSSNLRIDSGGVEDDRLRVLKLPFRYHFKLHERRWQPFIQGSVARMRYNQTYELGVNDEQVKPRYDSHSISLGGGVRFPLASGWSLAPAIDGGYAYLSSDAKYTGPIGEIVLKPAFDEILFNWSADAWLGNGHLTLQYFGPVGAIDLDAKFGYTLSHIQSYRTTTELQAFRENISTVSLKLAATYPLGVSLWDYPMSLVGRFGNSSFIGSNRDALGFTSLNEIGLLLQWDVSRHELPVKQLRLGGMGLWGRGVKGWSLLFDYRF